MTVETRLAEWLARITPDPPRELTVEDVAPLVRRPRRRWQPLLAAACIVLVAAAALVIVTRPGSSSSNPADTSNGPTWRTTTPPSTPSSTSSAPRLRLAVRPWRATPIATVPFQEGQLVAHDGVLVGSTGNGIAAVDTRGHVLARIDDATMPGSRLVIAHGMLWAVEAGPSGVEARSYSLPHLVAHAAVRITRGSTEGGSLFAAESGQLIVAAGHTIALVDPVGARVVRRLQIGGGSLISAVLATDGHVYAVTEADGYGRLTVLSADSGAVLSSTELDWSSLVAQSPGGLWVYYGSGHIATVTLRRYDGSDGASATGGGGYDPSVSIDGNRALLGGPQRISCADATTGQVLASARVGGAANISGLVRAGGRTFALYQDEHLPASALVELHPPDACR